MIEVQLISTSDNGVETIGKMYVTGDAHFACDTIERSYNDNKHGVSCIPEGKYICKKVGASEHIPYDHISVTNVPNRDGICIHAGNFFSDSLGCILVGKGFGDINNDGQQDILNSRNTLTSFMSVLPDEFNLTITRTNKSNLA